jgi:hypothetical protein
MGLEYDDDYASIVYIQKKSPADFRRALFLII